MQSIARGRGLPDGRLLRWRMVCACLRRAEEGLVRVAMKELAGGEGRVGAGRLCAWSRPDC